jgi:hypothetical protein
VEIISSNDVPGLTQEKDPEPLLSTYKLCRSFCNALRLEMLTLQAKEVAKGRWGEWN